ncbi:MAG: YqgE/AlgH family protein [Deltaproteobacteria bacterium]|nr:YqgE/AlgH family protein [Deltaproteobacteria bacterium]
MPAELTTGILVASPSLLDPNFAKSVVLLVQHQEGGSLGFVINRPADLTFPQIARELGVAKDQETPIPELPVLKGGPVAPHTGWLIFDKTNVSTPDENVLEVSASLCVSTSRDLLGTFARQGSAPRRILALGYAGWAPGQLDDEIKQGAWIPVQLDEKILFDTPIEDRWTAALALLGIDPRIFISSRPAEA